MIDGPSAQAGYPIVNYEYAVVSTRQPDAAKASAHQGLPDLGDHHRQRTRRTWTRSASSRCSPALVTLGEQQIAEIGS